MPTLSRSTGLFVAVCIVGIGVYLYVSAQPADAGSAKLAAIKSNAPDKPTEFTDQDYTARFDPPKASAPIHNVFLPLVRGDGGPSDAAPAQKDDMRIPPNLAGGDPNWIFTGYAVINGVRSALLENRSTHHSNFVNQGGSWKSTRLIRIDTGAVLFDDLAGGQVSVMRFDPDKAVKTGSKAQPDAGLKPMDVTSTIQGPIGQPNGGPGRRGPAGPQMMNGVVSGPMMINGMRIVSGG